MNNCISCLEPSKELNKGYCGKCETVIINRLTRARDHGTKDRSRAVNDRSVGPGEYNYFTESIIFCSKCDFTFNAKDVCQNCKRCIDCCPSWERQNC